MLFRGALNAFLMFGLAWTSESQAQTTPAQAIPAQAIPAQAIPAQAIPAQAIPNPPQPQVEFARIVRLDKDQSLVILGVQHSKTQKAIIKNDEKTTEVTSYVIYQEPYKVDLTKAIVLLATEGGPEPYSRELKRVEGADLWKRLAHGTMVAMVHSDPTRFDPKKNLRVVQGNLLIVVTGQRELSQDDLPKMQNTPAIKLDP